MPKTTLAEWLLTRLTGPTRAAAIMGDLTEMAATRSRLWFWAAYVRALVSLGWRTGGAAFILALVCVRLMFGTVLPWLMNHRTASLSDAGLFGVSNAHVRMLCWNLSLVTAQFLIFAFPFVWTRFGMQDRLTRLTCALFLVAIPVYTFRPWVMDISGILTLLVLAAALVAPHWRKPLAVLAGAFLPAVAVKAIYLFAFLLPSYRQLHMPRVPPMSPSWVVVSDVISFAVAAIVCLYLYRLLLRDRPAIA